MEMQPTVETAGDATTRARENERGIAVATAIEAGTNTKTERSR